MNCFSGAEHLLQKKKKILLCSA